jgi:hypothetical protein
VFGLGLMIISIMNPLNLPTKHGKRALFKNWLAAGCAFFCSPASARRKHAKLLSILARVGRGARRWGAEERNAESAHC